MALAVAAGLVACDDSAAAGPATTETTTTRELMFEDTGLRDVRMTSGRALGFVQPETGSQILCQLMEKNAWEELLDGKVGRKASAWTNPVCQIAFTQGLVMIELRQSDDALVADTTIAGRPAAIERGLYSVALTDEALEPAPRQYYPEHRLLSVRVTADDPDTERDIAEKVLEEIVPLAVEEGEPLPDIDDKGFLRYDETPLAGDFVDQPSPVQALQLCTLVQEELGLRLRDVEVRDTGECRTDDITVMADRAMDDGSYPDQVAGRPADTDAATGESARVLLRDDAGTQLYVAGEDAVGIAEKLVPLLIG